MQNETTIIWGELSPCVFSHSYKLIKFLPLFCHLLSFYELKFLNVPGLVIQMTLLKATQECTTLLQLKIDNIYVMQKTFFLH